MSLLGLEGVHVVVTGASGGIGFTTAKEFLEAGALVTLHCNTKPEKLAPLTSLFPKQTCVVQAPLTVEESVTKMFKDCVSKLGPVQVLVVNHGIWPEEDVLMRDMSLSQWKNTIDVNLTSSFLCMREFMRQLTTYSVTKNVAIVMIGSTAGKFGEAYHSDYSATKSAMMYGLTLSLKNEIVKIAPRGRVNTVAPGWVRTPMAEKAMNDLNILHQALASSPLAKVSSTEDIARAILFLSSEKMAGNVTGLVLDVNAGMEGRLLNSREKFETKL
eukprot:Lithocolla_globosa_v1_NODE_5346_length_1257_cov_10.846922.p1 type:complete len:272 gc:universal NODE_5346_length_1257_cov_10.846922:110-925(+)